MLILPQRICLPQFKLNKRKKAFKRMILIKITHIHITVKSTFKYKIFISRNQSFHRIPPNRYLQIRFMLPFITGHLRNRYQKTFGFYPGDIKMSLIFPIRNHTYRRIDSYILQKSESTFRDKDKSHTMLLYKTKITSEEV